MDVRAHQSVDGEISLPHPVVGLVDAAVEAEEQGHGVLGDGVRGIGRDAGDLQAERLCSCQIDVVKSGAAHGDEAGAAAGEVS